MTLGWDENTEPDLAGYRVYSSTLGAGGPYALHATVTGASLLDTSVANGATVHYYVTAFDAASHESAASDIVTAQPYDITPYTYTTNVTCSGSVSHCDRAEGGPDGQTVDLEDGESVTLDFGVGTGIIDGPGYDMVYYEWPNPPGILMDYVTIELSADGTTWYTVFAWDGTDGGVVGTNVDAYAADGESENEPIPSAVLYPGGLAFNTGIAIDIGPWTPPGYSYHLVHITDPGGSDDAQIDSVERLH